MSLWGVVSGNNSEQHVMPCEQDGTIENNHTPSADCWCKPKQDSEVRSMYIHNDPERGGFNA